jgi:hypothetical protein
MGQITVEVPQRVKRTYRIVAEDSADAVLKELDISVKESNHVGDDGVLGMWADREEAVEEIAHKLRRGWKRGIADD